MSDMFSTETGWLRARESASRAARYRTRWAPARRLAPRELGGVAEMTETLSLAGPPSAPRSATIGPVGAERNPNGR